MIGYNILPEQLKQAADETGVVLFDVVCRAAKGTTWKFTLRPGEKPLGYYGKAKPTARWQARRRGGKGRVWAVCWHGHREFFRAAFRLAPNARFKTKVDYWKGSEDFEARHERSAGINVGSAFQPVCAADNCFCDSD